MNFLKGSFNKTCYSKRTHIFHFKDLWISITIFLNSFTISDFIVIFWNPSNSHYVPHCVLQCHIFFLWSMLPCKYHHFLNIVDVSLFSDRFTTTIKLFFYKTFYIFFCVERYASYFTLCKSTQCIVCIPFCVYKWNSKKEEMRNQVTAFTKFPNNISQRIIFCSSFKLAGHSTGNTELNLYHLSLTPSNSFNSICRGGDNKITATLLLKKLHMTSSGDVQMYSTLYMALQKY